MSLTTSEMTPADIAAVTNHNGYGGGYGMGWGGNWGEWIVLFLIFGMFGWGGFGGFGGNGANGNAATQADIQRAVDQQTLISKIDQQTYGISQATYDINNTLQNGFSSAELSRCNQQAALMQQLYQMGYNQQDCCCQTQRAIDNVNYNMATNTCALQNTMNNNTRDIIDNQNAGTRAILDYLCQDKISSLQNENQALRLAASQDRQNALLTSAMAGQTSQIISVLQPPAPVPSYIVPNPNAVYYNGCNSGCAC